MEPSTKIDIVNILLGAIAALGGVITVLFKLYIDQMKAAIGQIERTLADALRRLDVCEQDRERLWEAKADK